MIELTSALLRSLAGAENSSVVMVHATHKYVNTVTDNGIDYCGFRVPERLFRWIKSSVKTDGISKLFKDEARLEFVHSTTNNGFSFCIKRDDKKTGYWSGLYASLDEAVADVDLLIAMATGADYSSRFSIIRVALDASGLAKK